MDGSEKIPIYLVFSKLVLDDVKVKILLISWHFLDFFSWCPTHPFIDTLIFWYFNGVQVVHIWDKFHLCLICSSQVFKFQMFSYQQKVQFQSASGRFFESNPPKCGQVHSAFLNSTALLQLSNKTSSRSYINHRILIKLFKKTQHFLALKWTF